MLHFLVLQVHSVVKLGYFGGQRVDFGPNVREDAILYGRVFKLLVHDSFSRSNLF